MPKPTLPSRMDAALTLAQSVLRNVEDPQHRDALIHWIARLVIDPAAGPAPTRESLNTESSRRH
jgi:hypothetical protein